MALGASLLHLGRPARALKALRNVRTSWLSREVALFSAFSAFSLAYAAMLNPLVGVLAVLSGVAGVYASGRLYLVPARPVWNSWRTPVAFFATAASTGPLMAFFMLDRSGVAGGWLAGLVGMAAVGTLAQLAVAAHLAAAVRRRPDRQHRGTAHLLLERFGVTFRLRLAAAVVGLMLLGGAVLEPLEGAAAGGRLAAAVVVIVAGELVGRWLFYVTVVPFRVAGSFFKGR